MAEKTLEQVTREIEQVLELNDFRLIEPGKVDLSPLG